MAEREDLRDVADRARRFERAVRLDYRHDAIQERGAYLRLGLGRVSFGDYDDAAAAAITEKRERWESILDMMRAYIAAADDFAAGKPIDVANLRAKLDLLKAELRTAAKKAGRG